LHEWIDGFFRKEDVIQLFQTPHPPRSPTAGKADAETVMQIVNERILCVVKINDNELWIVDSTGDVTSFKTTGTIKHLDHLEFSNESSFSLIEEGFLICDAANHKLTVFTQCARFDSTDIEIDHFISSGTSFCVIMNRTVIELHKINDFPDASAVLAVTEDVVQNAVMSSTFHLLCVVTRDNILHFYSLRKLRQTAATRIEFSSVKRLLITPTWGFVVVDFGNELAVFTVNGRLVGSYKHDCDFSHLGVLASADDFDYVVASDVKGKLMIIEAYRRRAVELVRQLAWQVIFADYIRDDDSLLVVLSQGKALMISRPFARLPETDD
jgi:hypothetical protein